MFEETGVFQRTLAFRAFGNVRRHGHGRPTQLGGKTVPLFFGKALRCPVDAQGRSMGALPHAQIREPLHHRLLRPSPLDD
jgi:hypothetical protein